MELKDARNALKSTPVRWTIAHKIGGLASVLILFILALFLYSIITLRGIQGELKEIAELEVPLTELTNKIEIEQLKTQITLDQILLLSQRKHTEAVDNRHRVKHRRVHGPRKTGFLGSPECPAGCRERSCGAA